jgi:hypothetical protein
MLLRVYTRLRGGEHWTRSKPLPWQRAERLAARLAAGGEFDVEIRQSPRSRAIAGIRDAIRRRSA